LSADAGVPGQIGDRACLFCKDAARSGRSRIRGHYIAGMISQFGVDSAAFRIRMIRKQATARMQRRAGPTGIFAVPSCFFLNKDAVLGRTIAINLSSFRPRSGRWAGDLLPMSEAGSLPVGRF